MALEGCSRIIKYLLFIFNLIFFISGLAVLALGISLNVNQGGYATLLPSVPFLNAANLCIAVGAIVMFVAFLGCCGAIREHSHLLIVFFLSLLLIFILEIVAGSLGFAYRNKVEKYVRKDLVDGLQNYNDEPGLQSGWDRLQNELMCCGIDGPGDWKNVTGFEEGQYPDSCCIMMEVGCGKKAAETHMQGCVDEFITILEDNIYYVGAVCIAIGLFEIIGMIFAMFLYIQLEKESRP